MTFKWTPDLSVGNDLVDRQHQEMFRRVDALVKAMAAGSSGSVVPDTLAFLERYVVEHFDAELDLMTKYKYPGIITHKAEHQKFMQAFRDLKSAYLKFGCSPAVVIDLQKSVCRWLKNHIATTDKALGIFLARPRARDTSRVLLNSSARTPAS
jgi:hemerythrin